MKHYSIGDTISGGVLDGCEAVITKIERLSATRDRVHYTITVAVFDDDPEGFIEDIIFPGTVGSFLHVYEDDQSHVWRRAKHPDVLSSPRLNALVRHSPGLLSEAEVGSYLLLNDSGEVLAVSGNSEFDDIDNCPREKGVIVQVVGVYERIEEDDAPGYEEVNDMLAAATEAMNPVDPVAAKVFAESIGKRVSGSGYPGATIAGPPEEDPDGKLCVPLYTSDSEPDWVPIENLTIESG